MLKIQPIISNSSFSDKRNLKTNNVIYGFAILDIVIVFIIPKPTIFTFVGCILSILLFTLFVNGKLSNSVAGIIACITGFLMRLDFSLLPLGYMVVGLVAAVICFIPLLTSYHQQKFPVIGIFGAVQGIYIYMGALVASPSLAMQEFYPLNVREVGTIASLVYAIVFVTAAIMAGKFLPSMSRFARFTSNRQYFLDAKETFNRCIVLFVVGIMFFAYLPAGISSRLGQFDTIVGYARIVAVAIMILMWQDGKLRKSQKVLVLLFIGLDAFSGLTGGFLLYAAVGAVSSALMVLTLKKPKIVMWLLVLFLPLSIFLNIAKIESRQNEPRQIGHLQSLLTLVHYTDLAMLHPTAESIRESADRFDDSELLGYMVVHVPKDYSYWNKKSYYELPWLLIPRVIVPFKPKYALANEFGRKYGLLNPDDYVTSANTPIQVEAWANFGGPGLVGIGLLVGILLALGERLYNKNYVDGIVLGVLASYQAIVGIESGISAFALVLPVTIIFIPIVRWALYGTT
jgi:hypothetical protein